MSLKLEREITRLRKELDKERKRIDWLIAQLKNNMSDIATATVTKILEEGLEADVVEKSTDDQIKELIKE